MLTIDLSLFMPLPEAWQWGGFSAWQICSRPPTSGSSPSETSSAPSSLWCPAHNTQIWYFYQQGGKGHFNSTAFFQVTMSQIYILRSISFKIFLLPVPYNRTLHYLRYNFYMHHRVFDVLLTIRKYSSSINKEEKDASTAFLPVTMSQINGTDFEYSRSISKILRFFWLHNRTFHYLRYRTTTTSTLCLKTNDRVLWQNLKYIKKIYY